MDFSQWPQAIGRNTVAVKGVESSNNNNNNNPKNPRPQKEKALNCPRCTSTNTKFCYYNNYSLSQPRYFCKTCRRYWTEGGSLRNVPVGGGSRKYTTRRVPSASSSSSLSSSSSKNIIITGTTKTTNYYNYQNGISSFMGAMMAPPPEAAGESLNFCLDRFRTIEYGNVVQGYGGGSAAAAARLFYPNQIVSTAGINRGLQGDDTSIGDANAYWNSCGLLGGGGGSSW